MKRFRNIPISGFIADFRLRSICASPSKRDDDLNEDGDEKERRDLESSYETGSINIIVTSNLEPIGPNSVFTGFPISAAKLECL